MITKQQAIYLLEEGFKVSNTSLVHGTNVESVIKLLTNGRLPSSFFRNNSDRPTDQGYLFFVPRKKSFINHPLYDQINIDLDGCKLEDFIKEYAMDLQNRMFISDEFDNCPVDLDPYQLLNEDFRKANQEFLKEQGLNLEKLEKYGFSKLKKEYDKRKGVCIGLNDKIFELDIVNGCDDPGNEVMIYLLDGLDIKYLQYIYPFGELEEKKLYEFITSIFEK